MMKKFWFIFAFVCLSLGIFGVENAFAQEKPAILGKYAARFSMDEDLENIDTFEIKEKNKAVRSQVSITNGETEEPYNSNATWSWNEAKKQLTVTIPPSSDGNQPSKLTFVFGLDGKNLKLVRKLVDDSPFDEDLGMIYKKQ